METLSNVQERSKRAYHLLVCPHCGEHVIVDWDELCANKVLFEPKEETYTCLEFGSDDKFIFDNKYKRVKTHLVSTDPTKDIYRLTCCNCDKEWNEPAYEIYKKSCNADGSKSIVFKLDEVESERARKFIEKHNHKADFKKENKVGFSTLGQQFTYKITPSSLGPLVSIKCNHCGKEKDITNVKNW